MADQQTHPPNNHEHQLVDRSIRLFNFLRELVQLRNRPVKHLNQFEKVLWLSDFPVQKNVRVPLIENGQGRFPDRWLEITKPEYQDPPTPPSSLSHWLDAVQLQDFNRDYPDLLTTQSVNGAPSADEDAPTRGEMQTRWEEYVDQAWLPWQASMRQKQAARRLFSELYAIYQRQENFGEVYEVLLGLGCLSWNVNGDSLLRHVITLNIRLDFDADRGLLRVLPDARGINPMLEQDFLDISFQPDARSAMTVLEQIQDLGDRIFDPAVFADAIQDWLSEVEASGVYENTLHPPTSNSETPHLSFAPAIILRKRSDQILLDLYTEILEQIHSENRIPAGLAALVSVVEPGMDSVSEAADGEDGEIYFSLPANEEQTDILRHMHERHGVLVQGPPGTGKSHTIANLISHLLANGKRVLVTSHTARALRVLQKMLPTEIAALCVVAAGDDERANQALETSVNGILDQFNEWDPDENAAAIERFQDKLKQSRANEKRLLEQLRLLRERETVEFQTGIGNYSGTLTSIAGRLSRERDDLGWFVDEISPNDPPPVDNESMQLYLASLRAYTPQQEKILSKILLDPDNLPLPQDFADQVAREKSVKDRLEGMAVNLQRMNENENIKRYGEIPAEMRKELLTRTDQLLDTHDVLDHHAYPWVRKAALEAIDGRYSVWEILGEKTRKQLKFVESHLNKVSELNISGLGGRDLAVVKEQALSLMAHLTSVGTLGFGIFRPKSVKDAIYLTREVYVEGQPCDSVSQLEQLIGYIDVAERLERLSTLWSGYIEPPVKAPFELQFAEYQNYYQALQKVLSIHRQMVELKALVGSVPQISEKIMGQIDLLKEFRKVLQTADGQSELGAVQDDLEEWIESLTAVILKPEAHHILEEIREHIQNRDVTSYESAYQTLTSIWEMSGKFRQRAAVVQLMTEKLPELQNLVLASPKDPIWDSRFAAFESAWRWAQVQSWMTLQLQNIDESALQKDLESNQQNIRDLVKRLAARKAWRACFSRMSESERQSLEAWRAAMRRIGKGTGKYAQDDRERAREHLEGCRNAIPAWVMPIYRVAETIRPGKEAFDVVIIDEASQSGPEALFLTYLAKQIVVVGDDNQISPEFIGISRAEVDKLRKRYLHDIPYNDIIGLDNSFFDQAKIRYGQPIRLREHFRSMPEIIEFSNQLSYSNEPLVPLRQYGSSRLSPVVLRRYVENGQATLVGGGVVNVPEAELLVRQVERCCKEQAYAGKSMGVISLQGTAQAQFIEKLLLKTLGAEMLESRQLVCGDAYAFQGDERDIMFLSMVAAPNRRIGTLASEKDMRRFNVAFSRARDQIFLFHSVTTDQLSENGLRHRLLKYCENIRRPRIASEALDLAHLWEQANISSRDRVAPPEPFENWFELDVFLKLTEQNVRVTPQYAVDRYRIDLVVEGQYSRVGVECLGDTWTDRQQFADNIRRRQRLERCGWRFVTIYSSRFYQAPEKELQNVWKAMAEGEPTNGHYRNGTVRRKASKVIAIDSDS